MRSSLSPPSPSESKGYIVIEIEWTQTDLTECGVIYVRLCLSLACL